MLLKLIENIRPFEGRMFFLFCGDFAPHIVMMEGLLSFQYIYIDVIFTLKPI